MFLTGGSSQLPYLDLFIADKLSLPVTYFNPLRNVNLGPALNKADLQRNNCYTAELVGLALRASGSCPAEVTLDAPSLAARADKKRKLPYYLAALAAWILLFVCLALTFYQQTNMAESVAKTLREKAQGVQTLAPKIGTLTTQQDTLLQTLNSAQALGVEHDAWAQILTALNDKIPDGVWITELVPVGGTGAPRPGGGPEVAPDRNRHVDHQRFLPCQCQDPR